jgi:hypothetical protein
MYDSLKAWTLVAITILVCSCATAPPQQDLSQFHAEDPRSILVVPATNQSVNVNAPDYFLATISEPLAERGYYVFPVNMVRSVLSDDGLSDANLVHQGDPRRLGQMFGADAVMYITIDQWSAKYVVLSTKVTVTLDYVLKSAKTGKVLWRNHQTMVYQPQGSSAGGLAGLVADAIQAAIIKAAPNYIPLAQRANALAIDGVTNGLPAGPYDTVSAKVAGGPG